MTKAGREASDATVSSAGGRKGPSAREPVPEGPPGRPSRLPGPAASRPAVSKNWQDPSRGRPDDGMMGAWGRAESTGTRRAEDPLDIMGIFPKTSQRSRGPRTMSASPGTSPLIAFLPTRIRRRCPCTTRAAAAQGGRGPRRQWFRRGENRTSFPIGNLFIQENIRVGASGRTSGVGHGNPRAADAGN